jgi:hypothetical protein
MITIIIIYIIGLVLAEIAIVSVVMSTGYWYPIKPDYISPSFAAVMTIIWPVGIPWITYRYIKYRRNHVSAR